MIAATSLPSWLVAVFPLASALAGAVIAQWLPEWFGKRRAVRERYDAAISAIAKARSAQHGTGMGVPKHLVKSITDQEHAELERDLSTNAFKRWIEADADARSALAALYPWSPDLKRFWEDRFINEKEFSELMELLYERRERPLTRYDERGRQATAF